ncbi:MAG: MFS transporter [bacterium]
MDSFVERYYKRNFLVNSLDVGFFTLGLTFVSTSTIFPVLIKNLGGSNLHIGLIPAIANLGWTIPSLFGAKLIANMPRKLGFILKGTVWERVPYLIIAILLLFLAPKNPTLTLYLSLLLLFVTTFAGGILFPAWLDLIGKIIIPSKRGTFFAIGGGIGGAAGIVASFIAKQFLETYPFPLNFFYCFLSASISLGISYLFISLAKEPESDVNSDEIGFSDYIKSLPTVLKNDRNFSFYILARVIATLGSMGVGFYTVYSLKEFALADEYAGIFSAFLLGSQTLSTFILGPIGDKRGHKLILSSGILSLTLAYLGLLLGIGSWTAYLAFTFLGINYSAFNTSGLALLIEFTDEELRAIYVALSNTIIGPFSFIAPIIGGTLANSLGYKIMFLISLILSLVGFLIMHFMVKEPRKSLN